MTMFKRRLDSLLVLNNVSAEDMRVGIPQFEAKDNNPELFTLYDLRFIAKKFNVSLDGMCKGISEKPCQKPCQNVVGNNCKS